MKPREKSNYKTILEAVDFNPLNPSDSERDLNREILERASLLALSNFASLHLAHAWEALAETTLLSRDITSLEGVADYVKKAHARHRKELYVLSAEPRKWIGVDS